MQINKNGGNWCGFNSYDKSVISELVKFDPVIPKVSDDWTDGRGLRGKDDWTDEQVNEFCSEISECFYVR